jgi:hypothetical protein
MKALGIALGAVAVYLVVKGMTPTATAAPYYPPVQPKAQPWYSQVLGTLGTVAGTALGTYAGLARAGAGSSTKAAAGTQYVVVPGTGGSVGNYSGGTIGSVVYV